MDLFRKNAFSEARGTIWEPIMRILIATLIGGIFYFLWLATFLLVNLRGVVGEWILWGTAPVVTAVGFAAGIALSNVLLGHEKVTFYKVLVWPLIGCSIGAAAIFWYGPMLIVFAMLLMGTLSLSLRELYDYISQRQSEGPPA
jgi:hypothetical protein